MADGDSGQGQIGSPMADAMSAGFDAISGVMGGIGDGIDAIFQVISKMMNAIIDASPMLQGVLKIVDKMFKLILMPIGNIIAKMLLPVAIKMANKTMAFLSKYGNAGPDQLQDMMTDGMSIALDSMIEMMSIVLFKVMPPLLVGLAKAIGSMITRAMGFGGANPEDAFGGSGVTSTAEDLTKLLGGAAAGAATVLNQFGMTVQTGNYMLGTSQTELVTAFYKGSVSIEDGFQSVHEVLVIGTTELMAKFKTDFNGSAAGVYDEIDTMKTKFKDLIKYLEPFEKPPEDVKSGNGDTKTEAKKGMDWWKYMEGATQNFQGILTGNRYWKEKGDEKMAESNIGHVFTGVHLADGGIATKPTKALIGEAGPEAVIPLGRNGGMGDTINITITGDIYGMDDFNRKIEQAVSKYSTRVRGAY